jgi:hypothetical protein
MITVKDLEAFCDADSNWVNELACRECLSMLQEYAHAHEIATCSHHFAQFAEKDIAVKAISEHRLVA